MDWSSPESWRWFWLAAAVVFGVGEIALAGSFFLAPFAVAAAIASVVSFGGGSVTASWFVFVAVAAGASLVLRPLARRLDASSPPNTVGVHRWTGRSAVVIEDIPAGASGAGHVLLGREEWRAQSESGEAISAGTPVVVVRVDGTRLIVRPD